MKRILVAAAVALVVGAACDSSSAIRSPDGLGWVHWRQDSPMTLERHVEVLVPVELGSDGTFLRGLETGIAQVNRSPYIQMTMDVGGACEGHCVNVVRRDLPYPTIASTTWGWDNAGHMFGHAATITFDIGPWTLSLLTATACHEGFHAAGLAHGQDHPPFDGQPDTQGPCQGGVATRTDLDNLTATTGHPDSAVFRTLEAEPSGPPMRVTESHTRAEMTALAAATAHAPAP